MSWISGLLYGHFRFSFFLVNSVIVMLFFLAFFLSHTLYLFHNHLLLAFCYVFTFFSSI